jgi:hypothetical protein
MGPKSHSGPRLIFQIIAGDLLTRYFANEYQIVRLSETPFNFVDKVANAARRM